MEALANRLDDARARKAALHAAGAATEHVDREILDLRRQLREGGQLRAGDALGDGRYLLTRIVGRGGFAVVWEAHDRATQQRVAIKVLHAVLAGDPVRRERFFRGARAMRALRDPAVVAVLDPEGEDGGFYYFVMEFVAGGNLREAVLGNRLGRDPALTIILQIADALALAHARRMVHRDIKPSNILLDTTGDAKLTDFDLVGAQDTTGGTRTGALGTIVYAAPECLDAPQDATARADVYGLGMTAIFCLGGRELSLSTFRNPEPAIAALDCSDRVRAVLRRAIAWEPTARFVDAATMAAALRAALRDPLAGAAGDERVRELAPGSPGSATGSGSESSLASRGVSATTKRAAQLITGDIAPSGLRNVSGALVLWVDDHPENNHHERLFLESLGIVFMLAESTEEALDKLTTRSFAAIISDMGRESDPKAGYTLLASLRRSGHSTPFIIYSSSNAPEYKAEARLRGALGSTSDRTELFEYVLAALGARPLQPPADGAGGPVTAVQRPSWAVAAGSDAYGPWSAFEVNGVYQRMRWIPRGTFRMGSPDTEPGRFEDEGPQHEVTITRGYWLGATPVTQALWVTVMGDNPSRFRDSGSGDLQRPVERVSWYDCQTFIGELNARTPRLAARLPTEAEWERACRGGTTAATWMGGLTLRGLYNAPELDAIAWYGGNSGVDLAREVFEDSSTWPEKQYPHTRSGIQPVGRKQPNPYGLHDMLGNVYEWCMDTYPRSYGVDPVVDPVSPVHGEHRVNRGGSWRSRARSLRAARRGSYAYDETNNDIGLRLAAGQAAGPGV